MFCLLSCENDLSHKEVCSIQGFNDLKSKNITCNEQIKLYEVDFSNGITQQLVQGNIKINGTNYPFNLILDSTAVVDYTFKFIDSLDYKCSLKKTVNDLVEIEWEKETKRIFLRKKIILVH